MNVDLAKQSQISEADQRSSPYLWRLRQSAEKLAAAAPHAAHKTRALFPPADDARQHARGARASEHAPLPLASLCPSFVGPGIDQFGEQ